MAINYPNFPLLTFDQANPALVGAQRGMDMYSQGLKNISELLAAQKAKAMLPYAGQQAAADVAYTNSAAGLNQFNLQHPAFINPLAAYISHLIGGQGQNQASVTQPTIQPMGGASSTESDQNLNAPNSSQTDNSQSLGDYGIPTPKLSAGATDPVMNKIVGVSPTDQKMLDWTIDQRKNQAILHHQAIDESANDANMAQNYANNMAAYNKLYNQAEYTGPTLGTIGHPGDLSTRVVGTIHDFTPEQKLDYLSTKSFPSQVHDIRAAMQSGVFNRQDTQMAEKQLPQRTDAKNAVKFKADLSQIIADRMSEVNHMRTVLANPKLGARKDISTALIADYQKDNPITNGEDALHKENVNQGKWKQYVSPEAVYSMTTQGEFHPSTNKQNVNRPPANVANTANPGGGFDPSKILSYKFKNSDEFNQAFNTLDKNAQSEVRTEMKRRKMYRTKQ